MKNCFEKADFVFFDTPREHIEDFVKGKNTKGYKRISKKSKKPYMWMRTKILSGENLSKQNIEKLHAYYVLVEVQTMTTFSALHFLAKMNPIDKLPPPIIFPESAICYPGGEKIVFETLPEYIKYRNVSIGTKPIVAISIHQQYVSAEQAPAIG